MKMKKGNHIVNSFSYLSDKETIMRELEVIAAREGKSKSNLLVELIEEYVKNHSEGNNTFKLDIWAQDPEFKALPTLLAPKEKWIDYIDTCNDDECTKIAIMANHVNRLIQMRRTKEWKEEYRRRK